MPLKTVRSAVVARSPPYWLILKAFANKVGCDWMTEPPLAI